LSELFSTLGAKPRLLASIKRLRGSGKSRAEEAIAHMGRAAASRTFTTIFLSEVPGQQRSGRLAFCEIQVARGTVRSSATSMGAVEFGEILIIKFCTERAVKGIPLATPAFLQNICRPIWLNRSVEGL
jgi:hypothetical protein